MADKIGLDDIVKRLNEELEKFKMKTRDNFENTENIIKTLRDEIREKNNRYSDIQYLKEDLRTFMTIYKNYMYCEGMNSFYNSRSNALWAEAKSIKTIITAFNDKFKEEVVK